MVHFTVKGSEAWVSYQGLRSCQVVENFQSIIHKNFLKKHQSVAV